MIGLEVDNMKENQRTEHTLIGEIEENHAQEEYERVEEEDVEEEQERVLRMMDRLEERRKGGVRGRIVSTEPELASMLYQRPRLVKLRPHGLRERTIIFMADVGSILRDREYIASVTAGEITSILIRTLVGLFRVGGVSPQIKERLVDDFNVEEGRIERLRDMLGDK